MPVGRQIANRRTARRGVVIGTLFLLVAALLILLALATLPETVSAELPMLALAQRLHPALGRGFAALLLFAMFGTALSCTVAAREYLTLKLPRVSRRPWAAILPYTALAYAGGLLGFGDLIGWIYPLFGYLGCFVLLSVIAHERHVRREESGHGI